MKRYTYYSRFDENKERIDSVLIQSRLAAAKHFAERKVLSLKEFLIIYAVTK